MIASVLYARLGERLSQLAPPGDTFAERVPAVRWHPPEATFLAWLDCSALGPEDEARELFLERGRVALEPGTRFGAAGAGFCRLNFGTGAEILDQATAGMAAAVNG